MEETPIPRKTFLAILGSAILGLLILPSLFRKILHQPLKKRKLPLTARKEPRAVTSSRNIQIS